MKNLLYNREAKLREIINIYNLNQDNPYFPLDEKLFEFLYKNSNKPYYHNWEHILFVVIESVENPLFQTLSHKEKIQLVIASLFHDVGHYGDKTRPDIDNINKAIELLKLYYGKENEEVLLPIIEIIQSTENSYNIFPIDNLQKQIIHDADLHCTSYEDRLYFMKNLSKEFDFPVNIQTTKEFLKTQKFYTPRGIKKQKELLEEIE